jgi:hypothetical protein
MPASRGWELETSLIEDRERLNRLLLALFLAMWWVIHLAASCIHQGQRDRFDRHDFRDKSVFRLGCLWLQDILRRIGTTAFAAATLTCCLPFRKTASGWRFSLPLLKRVRERAEGVRPTSRTPPRTAQGPRIHSSPCPYRILNALYLSHSSKFIRTQSLDCRLILIVKNPSGRPHRGRPVNFTRCNPT